MILIGTTDTDLCLVVSKRKRKKEKRIMVIECLFIAQEVVFVEDNLKTFAVDTGGGLIGVILRRE